MAKRRTSRGPDRDSEYLYGLGPAKMAETRIRREASRVSKHAARLKSYNLPDESVVTDLRSAQKLLLAAAGKLAKVPKNWRPARGTLGATPLEEGQLVVARDEESFAGLLDTDKPIKVAQINGSRVVLVGTLEGKETRTNVSRSLVRPA